ncbi:hypothetical protein [Faecalicatena contorta]|uniref:Dolichyl-phosphate-mannose-protein mannosyltransferase n=1 Tax=Faecalicatena contorta TaxID=39482 RepID=A0A315ZSV4_9FIRM|nr:hypothetical protein [Faecalicatena contorta]PWJ48223.1 hypothetical protein A8805_11344 [Faecalicatena contorta]SUQ15499.1 hypothetical protein SAMN05216529_11344 [Faecalicatena contorta]
MNKENLSDKRIKEMMLSLFMTIIAIVIMVLLGASYETNDDWSIALQLSRGGIAISSFQSPYLALLVSSFYMRFPSLPWWGMLAFLGAASLMWIGFYITFRTYRGGRRYVFLFGIAVLVWLVGIRQINFTRTAMLFTIAGNLSCTFYLYTKDKKIEIVLGILGIIIGGMIRFQAALVVIPFFIVPTLYFLIVKRQVVLYKYFLLLGTLTPVLALVSLYAFNTLYLNEHNEWQTYQSYNYKRGIIQDYAERYPSWDEAKREYERLGLKKDDITMFMYNWFSEDTEVFDDKIMEGIMSLSDSKADLNHVLKSIFEQLKNTVIFWMVLIYSIFVFIESRKKILLPIVLINSMVLGIITYFCIQGRIQNRVSEPLLLCALFAIFLIAIYIDDGNEFKNSSYNLEIKINSLGEKNEDKIKIIKIPMVSVLFCVLTILLLFPNIKSNLENMHIPYFDEGRNGIVKQKTDYINETADRIYLLTVTSDEWDKGFNMWENVPVGYCENMFFLGGWSARTPDNIQRLKRENIDNPAAALFEKENVYSVYDEGILEFLKRHYDARITSSRVDSFPDDNNTSIVQYTAPKERPEKNDETIKKVKIFSSEYCQYDNREGWTITGEIESPNAEDYQVLYCNVKVGKNIYTYRLHYDKGEFSGNMYDLNKLIDREISECYLIGKNAADEYIYIEDIKDLIH